MTSSVAPLLRRLSAGLALTLGALTAGLSGHALAACPNGAAAATQFIQFPSPNIATQPPSLLTIKGKLSYPGSFDGVRRCIGNRKLPAVVILHGSNGWDPLGDFYQQALNAAGIVTLQIDMWEARGASLSNRPAAPILTYPDAFSALNYLAALPEVDAARIGVLGFSWGGVISLAASEQLYSGLFGQGRTFAAHVATYPVCWGANNTTVAALQPAAEKGTQLITLTGKPVLIQIGTADDYDNGSAHCKRLAAQVNASNGPVVTVAEYPGAAHAFDLLMVERVVGDIYANEGSYFFTGVVPPVRIIPNVALAHQARARAVSFFKAKL